MLNSKIAVLVHVFYIDMWDEIEKYLQNLKGFEYDLYVNLVDGFYTEEFLKDIEKKAKVTISPNKGVDVGGFLFQYNSLEKEYDLILKIHTKKSLGLPDKPSDYVRVYGYEKAKNEGKEWFHRLMNSVLKSKEQVQDIINFLTEDTPFAMAGLDYSTYIGPNVDVVEDLSKIFNIPIKIHGDKVKNAGFVGGTIFWVKNDILKKYLTKDNVKRLLELLPYGYVNEPSYNHALERMFGFMVYNENKKIINL